MQAHVTIHGRRIERMKLQLAKLKDSPCKCALQMMSVLYTVEEMVNGNPSGITNSKDEKRQSSIQKLDRDIIKYIQGKQ